MMLPPPRATLGGCIWLPRLLGKARALNAGSLPPEYMARFGHATGVDGQFLAFFQLTKEEVIAVCDQSDEEAACWFLARPQSSPPRIAEWNHLAVNLGRPGFPMAERMPIALSTTYRHLADRRFETIFEVLEADEA